MYISAYALRLITIRIQLHFAAEEVVNTGCIKQNKGHANQGDDEHNRQRVRLGGSVGAGEIILFIYGRNEEGLSNSGG